MSSKFEKSVHEKRVESMLTTILATLKKIESASDSNYINGWVCEKVFKQRSGLDTPKQLFDFRKAHPELVRVNGRKFIYDMPGYFDTFKSLATVRKSHL